MEACELKVGEGCRCPDPPPPAPLPAQERYGGVRSKYVQ